MANCPKCGGHVSHLATENVPIGIMQIPAEPAVAYVCPDRNCRTILGIAADPFIVASDRRALLRSRRLRFVSRRTGRRDREFADSPLEGAGFELTVPPNVRRPRRCRLTSAPSASRAREIMQRRHGRVRRDGELPLAASQHP
jgi:hypothetical protein